VATSNVNDNGQGRRQEGFTLACFYLCSGIRTPNNTRILEQGNEDENDPPGALFDIRRRVGYLTEIGTVRAVVEEHNLEEEQGG
jgi:hypothetical protein